MSILNVSPVFRRRALLLFWATLALSPLLYIASQSAAASRNFPFWDELDSAIDFVLKLSAGGTWWEQLQQFFALSNEHRMVTSRIIFATSYWLTGTVNFHVIGVLGNLFIVGTCALLIGFASGTHHRLRLAVVLALLVFQLEHFENFVWSGASIDHFQVIFLAVAAFTLLTRDSTTGCALAAGFAMLATLTLVHGSVVWPLGILYLAHRREWRRLSIWTTLGFLTLAAFFAGFSFNPGHNIPQLTPSSAAAIGLFWLQLIGCPLTLGVRTFAAAPGLLLLATITVLAGRGAMRKHPLAMLTALFGILSLALVAFGRVHTGIDTVTSRYIILAALPWAMVISILLEEAATPDRPFRWLAYVAPGLVMLNVTADVAFQGPKEAFIEVRDRAATHFKGFGRVGEGISRIHPHNQHADEILAAAYEKGVYHMGRVSELAAFRQIEPSKRIVTHMDELVTNERAVLVGGWAMIPGKTSKRGQVYLVLQSEESLLIYSTLTIQRPDVARAYKEPRWRLCGFRAVIGRNRLPPGDYKIGVLIADGGKGEFLLTDNRLNLAQLPTKQQLATVP